MGVSCVWCGCGMQAAGWGAVAPQEQDEQNHREAQAWPRHRTLSSACCTVPALFANVLSLLRREQDGRDSEDEEEFKKTKSSSESESESSDLPAPTAAGSGKRAKADRPKKPNRARSAYDFFVQALRATGEFKGPALREEAPRRWASLPDDAKTVSTFCCSCLFLSLWER